MQPSWRDKPGELTRLAILLNVLVRGEARRVCIHGFEIVDGGVIIVDETDCIGRERDVEAGPVCVQTLEKLWCRPGRNFRLHRKNPAEADGRAKNDLHTKWQDIEKQRIALAEEQDAINKELGELADRDFLREERIEALLRDKGAMQWQRYQDTYASEEDGEGEGYE